MAERHAAMVCPVDGTNLVMSERQNIEIDYCPTCRGVWLDRGELDKIIERSAGDLAPAPQAAPPPQSYAPPPAQPHYRDSDRDRDSDRGHYRPHKRRKSFFEELFD